MAHGARAKRRDLGDSKEYGMGPCTCPSPSSSGPGILQYSTQQLMDSEGALGVGGWNLNGPGWTSRNARCPPV